MAGDVKVAVVSGAITSTSTNFTKSGFGTPKAAIIIVTHDEADDTNAAAHNRASIGFTDFTNDFCISHQDEDASANVDCDAIKSNTLCYLLMDEAASTFLSGTGDTTTDGVTLTNTTESDVGSFATVIMFGGGDLIVSLDSVAVNSSENGTTVVTPGNALDADLVFFIGSDISAEDSSSTGINNSFGVAHIDTSNHTTFVNRCMGWASDHDNTESVAHAVNSTDRVLDMLTEAGVQDWGLELTAATSIAARSFSYTVTTRDTSAGANMECYALALDLDDRGSKIGSVDSPTSGSTWTPSVSLGFIPQYVGLLLNVFETEDTIAVSQGAANSIGISSNTGSSEETCNSWYNQDGLGVTNTNNKFRSRAIDIFKEDTSTISHDHSHSSFNSGDWTYTINTENETLVKKWFYWTIEEAAGPESLIVGTVFSGSWSRVG